MKQIFKHPRNLVTGLAVVGTSGYGTVPSGTHTTDC